MNKNDPANYTPPSMSDFEQMTALEQRRSFAPFDDKVDALKMKKREELSEEKTRQSFENKLYFKQNFNSELDIKNTEYPSVPKPGEEKKYQDAQTGPFDQEQWGLDGRWFYWNRYKAASEAVPLKSLFK